MPNLTQVLTEARARGKEFMAHVLRDPTMLSADTLAGLIRVTQKAVYEKRARHELLGLRRSKHGYRFPAWQLDENGQLFLAGILPRLFDTFGDAWSVQRFLLQVHPELKGKTALEALKNGEADRVLAVARNIAAGAFS